MRTNEPSFDALRANTLCRTYQADRILTRHPSVFREQPHIEQVLELHVDDSSSSADDKNASPLPPRRPTPTERNVSAQNNL